MISKARRVQLEAEVATYAEEMRWVEKSEANLRATFELLLSQSQAQSKAAFQEFAARSLRDLNEQSRNYRRELTDQTRASADEFSNRIGSHLTSHAGQIGILKSSLDSNIGHLEQQVRELETKREVAYVGLRETFEKLAAQSVLKLTDQSRANADQFAGRIDTQLKSHAGQIDFLKTALETNLHHLDTHVRELEAKREVAYVSLREAFGAIASHSLTKLTDQSRATADEFSNKVGTQLTSHADRIGLLKSSLENNIDKMDQYVRDLETKREGAYSSLTETVSSLSIACREIIAATLELNTALRIGPGRGRWGEIQLRKVVEMAGMVEHVSFNEQPVGDDGKPDMVVRLPREGNISIDSKFVAKSFFEAMQSADAGVRQQKLDEHSQSLRQTIRELSQRVYWEQFQPSPEIVIMFIPLESWVVSLFRVGDFGERGFFWPAASQVFGVVGAGAGGFSLTGNSILTESLTDSRLRKTRSRFWKML